jgi:nitroreductase
VRVSEAVATRMSARAFLPREVPEAVIRELLETARRAPSGGNLQPWHVYVLRPRARQKLVRRVRRRMLFKPKGEGSEYRIYPPDLREPYRSRRYGIGEAMYATIGIAREDRSGRRRQFARNFEFFGAPWALILTIDRDMEPGQFVDLGLWLQTVMLLARERGLHTCAQEAWAYWHKTVRKLLKVPEEQMIFCGLAIGYRDDRHPINSLVSERAPLEETTTFVG